MHPPAFDSSARRHLADAELLQSGGRQPNADHLAGFSAECALKALVLAGLGGTVRSGYAFTAENVKLTAHVESIWDQIVTLLSGRGDAAAASELLSDNPFADWHVSDRYASGTHVTADVLSRHLDGARRANRALEAMRIVNSGGVG